MHTGNSNTARTRRYCPSSRQNGQRHASQRAEQPSHSSAADGDGESG